MAPWDSPAQRETWEPLGQQALLDPRERKEIRAEDLLCKEKRVKRAPWACRVPQEETAAKACGGSQENRASRGCPGRWACGDPRDRLDFQDLPAPSALPVSMENKGKREPGEKRGSKAWMDSPGSRGRLVSREDPALPVSQGPRGRRVPWVLQAPLGFQALWCRERA